MRDQAYSQPSQPLRVDRQRAHDAYVALYPLVGQHARIDTVTGGAYVGVVKALDLATATIALGDGALHLMLDRVETVTAR